MVMVLEQHMVDQIAQIGLAAYPHEACGLLLPTPVRGQQVIQLPNRSKEPLDSVEVDPDDFIIEMELLYGEADAIPDEVLEDIVVWHTHPSGNVGPSKYDMENKPAKLGCLVVAIYTDGRPPLATWF